MSRQLASDLTHHPNSIVPVMASLGYTLDDLLPAYPGRDVAYVDQVLRDNALALSRPVIPYGLLGIHAARTPYFNISQHGFRLVDKDQPWPPAPDRINIFVFGGSTVLGYNVEDQHAIPYFLQQKLRAAGLSAEVYNFGCGSYTGRQEALRFLDLLDRGIVPRIAVFLDGCNDSFYAFGNPALLNALDQLYQSEKRRRRSSYPAAILDYAREAFNVRRKPMPAVATYKLETTDPDVLRLASPEGIAAALADTAAPADPNALPPGQRRLARATWDRYLDSVHVIRALANRHGVETLFAWQPVPFFATRPEARILEKLFYAFPASVFAAPVYKWLAASRFPDWPEGTRFLDLSRLGAERQEVCYVDLCHYNAFFADIIAENLVPALTKIISEKT